MSRRQKPKTPTITQVLLDGADEGPCRKPKFFKQDGDQYANMSCKPEKPMGVKTHRQKLAERWSREYQADKLAPKDA